MKTRTPSSLVLLVSISLCLPTFAGEGALLSSLTTENVETVRIDLNPWGARLGFETEIDGVDPRLQALLAVVRRAEPGGGHKCPNRGAMRFRMVGGRVIALGLLPSHEQGVYELRLYEGDDLRGVYRVNRADLLAALEGLDVPVDDPAFAD